VPHVPTHHQERVSQACQAAWLYKRPMAGCGAQRFRAYRHSEVGPPLRRLFLPVAQCLPIAAHSLLLGEPQANRNAFSRAHESIVLGCFRVTLSTVSLTAAASYWRCALMPFSCGRSTGSSPACRVRPDPSVPFRSRVG
jgi:hypothetical protein